MPDTNKPLVLILGTKIIGSEKVSKAWNGQRRIDRPTSCLRHQADNLHHGYGSFAGFVDRSITWSKSCDA
jgi:hypothetical protein